MESFIRHMRHRLLSGVVVLIPAVISFMVLKLVYNLTVGIVSSAVQPMFKDMPTSGVVAISILALVLFLYIVGIFAANMIGRQVIQFFERLVARVPLVDSIYSTAKQIVEMFRSQPGVSRRTVVIVPFPHPETRAMGFKTGEVILEDGRRMATVFIATTPNPTTGFLQIFPLEDVQELDVSADEAVQFIMSGGILQPKGLAKSIDL
jgi:uncharacterized membrane protein